MHKTNLIALAALVCVLMAPAARAQYFSEDGIVDSFTPEIIVGFAGSHDFVFRLNPTSPTVTIVAGGVVMEGHAYNSSTIVVSGTGQIGRVLTAHDHAGIVITGHNPNNGYAVAADNGGVIFGGGVVGGLSAIDNGTISAGGGIITGSILTSSLALGTVTGTKIGDPDHLSLERIFTSNQAQLQVDGAEVFGRVVAEHTSKIMLGGSTVHGPVLKFQNSDTPTFKINNSTIDQQVDGHDVDISGGTTGGSVSAFILNLTGGTVGGGVGVSGDGAVGTVSNALIGGGLSVGGTGASMSASGTTIAGGVSAGQGTTLNLSGGTVGAGVFGNNAIISANNTSITGGVSINGFGQLASATITDSTVVGDLTTEGSFFGTRNALITFTGGSVSGNVTANNRSAITLINTSVGGNITANSGSPLGSLVEIQGGTVTGNAESKNQGAEVRLISGEIKGDLKASGQGNVTILSGIVRGNLMLNRSLASVMSGGEVAGKADMELFNTFTMTGGSIAGKVSVKQASQFNFSNGTLGGDLDVIENATAIMTGGSIAGALLAKGASIVEVSGGTITKGIIANEGAMVTVSGGQIDDGILGFGESQIVVSGGAVDGGASTAEVGTFTMSGGSIAGEFVASGQSRMNISGGFAKGPASASNRARLNLSGSGVIAGDVLLVDSAIGNISGGRISGGLTTLDSSFMLIEGGAIDGKLQVRNNSVVATSGGVFAGNLEVSDTGSALVDGGSFLSSILAKGNATIFLEGAFSAPTLRATETSRITMKDGSVGVSAFVDEGANLRIEGSAFIGQVTAQGTVNMSGGNVGTDVKVENNGKMVLSGGSIAGKLVGTQKADIAMTGGTVGRIEASQDQQGGGVTIGGGSVTGDVRAFDRGAVLILAGTVVGSFNIQDQGTGEIGSIAAINGTAATFDFAILNMSGGSVGVGASPASLEAGDNSTINLSGGTVGLDLRGFEQSTINMTGGTVFGRGILHDKSKLNFIGGEIHGGVIQVPGRLAAAAEEPVLAITAFDDATVNIIGSGLVATLVDPNVDGTSKYQLSGLLADGTVIDGGFLFVQNGSQAGYQLKLGSNWKIDGGGSWGVGGNWATGAVPDAAGTLAQFLGTVTAPSAPANITLDGNRTLGSLTLDNVNSHVISGPGSLIFDNGPAAATMDVRNGNHSIAAPVILAGELTVNISPSASLSIEHVRGGSLNLAAGRMNILSNGTEDGTSKLNSQSIAPGATLDLNDNDLIIEQGDVTAIGALVASARAAGDWTGDGLTSSAAKANGLTGLGVIANNDGSGAPLHTVFSGQSVALDDVLVKYTWNGDADLNGGVDADDYFQIDNGFASAGALVGWRNGDFDYSGGTDADDYFLIDNAFASQTGVLGGAGGVTVPEPAMLASLTLTSLCLLRTRRQNRIGGRVRSGQTAADDE